MFIKYNCIALNILSHISIMLFIFNSVLMRDVIENSPELKITSFSFFVLTRLECW